MAPVERKFFPNDQAEVVTVNLARPLWLHFFAAVLLLSFCLPQPLPFFVHPPLCVYRVTQKNNDTESDREEP